MSLGFNMDVPNDFFKDGPRSLFSATNSLSVRAVRNGNRVRDVIRDVTDVAYVY